jgi:hypothetical protein
MNFLALFLSIILLNFISLLFINRFSVQCSDDSNQSLLDKFKSFWYMPLTSVLLSSFIVFGFYVTMPHDDRHFKQGLIITIVTLILTFTSNIIFIMYSDFCTDNSWEQSSKNAGILTIFSLGSVIISLIIGLVIYKPPVLTLEDRFGGGLEYPAYTGSSL